MRSPERAFLWLVAKECRELMVSKAWWALLLAAGPLVGVSFISAARTYAEVSGLSGTAGDAGDVLSPLIGIWGPAFSSCELAAVFLLPFVAIQLVSGDRRSGALKLELQQGLPSVALIAAKAVVLLAGWLVAMLPALSAIVLWRTYGGSVYAPELGTVIAGHVLNGALTIGLASAMSSISEHPSTAAILTLSITVGTWIVSFFAAVQGGLWERAARYTPSTLVAEFQHGLLRLDVLLVGLVLALVGLLLAAIWIRLGIGTRRRAAESAILGLLAAGCIVACSFVTVSWDTSEARYNSFPVSDERALQEIRMPLRIEVHLAPEDPRRADLEHRALSKLRRIMPGLQVVYRSNSTTGFFEQSSAGYGEIWYDLAGRKTMSRVTTAEGVLETIYSLAGITPPPVAASAVFRGHPLAVPANYAGSLFYAFWPAVVLISGIVTRKRVK